MYHRKPTRIAIRFSDDGEKLRVSKKTGTIIPKPAILKERHNPRRTGACFICKNCSNSHIDTDFGYACRNWYFGYCSRRCT
jgi:hypothetical protein